MTIIYSTLQSEIENDPDSLGYAGKSDVEIADLMNAVSATYQIDIDTVPTWKILGATDWAEWNNLNATLKQLYQTFVSVGELDLKSQRIRQAFGFMFPAGSNTRSALIALQAREGSRGESLFGSGTVIRHTDVAIALGRG